VSERQYTHTTKGCYGCGDENEQGLRLKPWLEGDGLCAEFTPQAFHRGFSKVVHGGVIAAVLDEVITSAVAVASNALLATVSLHVDFKAPMLVAGEYTVRARRVADEGNVRAGEGEIVDGRGTIIARGRGKFVPLGGELAKKFLG